MAGLPDYHEFADGLEAGSVSGGAAEAHGTLCGLLCGPSDDLPQAWIDNTLADAHEDADSAPVNAHALLVRLYEATCSALQGEDMAFTPLLPGDSEGLDARLEALAAWSQGFLYGLAVRGLRDLEQIDAQIREFLEDLLEISRVDTQVDDDTDADEAAYLELVEYVRVGVQLLYDETRPVARPAQKSVS